MKQNLVAGIIIGFFLLGIVGGVVYYESTKSAESNLQQPTKSDVSATNRDAVTLGQTVTTPLNPAPEESAQQSKNPETTFLDPSEFKTYDTYKTSDKMLVIDKIVGTGADAIAGKKVAVNYVGWLTDGTIFDSSKKDASGQITPLIFTLGEGRVIAGWEQGLIGMKEGGTRRLVIPPQAAYGEAGQGPVPPNAVLIFDIDLLEVEK